MITHLQSDRIYIGKANNPCKRWQAHRTYYTKPKTRLQRAIHKYGKDQFVFQVLLETNSEQAALKVEYDLVKFFDSTNETRGFNIEPGGGRGEYKKRPPRSEEWCKNLSVSCKARNARWAENGTQPQKGRKHSEETRAKMRKPKTKSRPPISDETRLKRSVSIKKILLERWADPVWRERNLLNRKIAREVRKDSQVGN